MYRPTYHISKFLPVGYNEELQYISADLTHSGSRSSNGKGNLGNHPPLGFSKPILVIKLVMEINNRRISRQLPNLSEQEID